MADGRAATTRRITATAEDRLAEIENEQWRVISGLEKGQERTVAILDAIATRLEGLEKKVGDATRPQWQAMGVMLSAVIAIGSLVGIGINSKINNVDEKATKTAQQLYEHVKDGHPASVIAKIEANKEALNQQIEADGHVLDQMEERFQRDIDRLRDRIDILSQDNDDRGQR